MNVSADVLSLKKNMESVQRNKTPLKDQESSQLNQMNEISAILDKS